MHAISSIHILLIHVSLSVCIWNRLSSYSKLFSFQISVPSHRHKFLGLDSRVSKPRYWPLPPLETQWRKVEELKPKEICCFLRSQALMNTNSGKGANRQKTSSFLILPKEMEHHLTEIPAKATAAALNLCKSCGLRLCCSCPSDLSS